MARNGNDLEDFYEEELPDAPDDEWQEYERERQARSRGDHRRRIEKYMELKRLLEQIGDDNGGIDDDDLSKW